MLFRFRFAQKRLVKFLLQRYERLDIRILKSEILLQIIIDDRFCSHAVHIVKIIGYKVSDLRQSEQTLRAAEAAMGMASADRFPRITFSLTGGWENDDLKGLFSSPFSYVNGSLVSPLFSFGKKKAKYKAALAACDEARLNYEQKVLEAFREVNDAVVTYRNVRTAAALKRDLQQAAQKYVELAQLQYFNGVINYLDVLDAQRKYFDAQIGLSNAVRDEHLAMVDLYKALGGGWGVERE